MVLQLLSQRRQEQKVLRRAQKVLRQARQREQASRRLVVLRATEHLEPPLALRVKARQRRNLASAPQPVRAASLRILPDRRKLGEGRQQRSLRLRPNLTTQREDAARGHLCDPTCLGESHPSLREISGVTTGDKPSQQSSPSESVSKDQAQPHVQDIQVQPQPQEAQAQPQAQEAQAQPHAQDVQAQPAPAEGQWVAPTLGAERDATLEAATEGAAKIEAAPLPADGQPATVAAAAAQDGGATAVVDHGQAINLALDTQNGGAPGGAAEFKTAVQATPVRSQRRSDEVVITTNVVLHSSGMTFEERKAELENLIQVRPAVVNVKTLDDDGFQEEKTTQNVLIGKNMIVVERKSILLVGFSALLSDVANEES
ncbi:unnamed protein product [Heligmosomoides polygyrus]|uniref:Glutaredoxin domain-containing protein n=1 Tax=Heligmosomoides polygyrus TaxID=6339 RepID=A0A183FZN5_HELPZ|nr:unnamed protein product [Heligmosomoides polygyrus]